MEKIVRANRVAICVETFGERKAPAILLIGGMACSMDYWEVEFCRRLAAGPRFVIRYDFRDTGRSVSYPPGAPPYTSRDLRADAIGLLGALGLARAHVAGISMGGGLAQILALEHPDRVASLILMSTSPGGDDLPPMAERLRKSFERPRPEPDWSDRAAVIDHLVAANRPYAGSLPGDEAAERELLGRIFDRTVDMASSAKNHGIMMGDDDDEPLRPRLGRIRAPTLVLHGTEDPLLPYPHAVALAREIPGAVLVAMDKVGHEYPPRAVWDVVIPAILRHTS
ncbi:MAG TPA: alpha/beta hydrolase [Candidatus Acidoferrum sp.]|nr:alpha/beta hydrolase [Candidatus Acidoferrum sp.]